MTRWVLWGFVAVTPHLAVVQYLPLIVFLAARPLSKGRDAAVLMLLITLQCLTDPVYVAVAVLVPLGILAASRIARPAWHRSGLWLMAVLVGSLVPLIPIFGSYARVRANDPDLVQHSTWAGQAQIFHRFGGVLPTDLSGLFWRAAVPTTMAPAILGVIVVGAMVAAVQSWRRRGSGLGQAWRHAGLWALAGTWMSIGPVASIGSAANGWPIRTPQYFLVPSSFYQVVRIPERLGVVGMIGLCLLAGTAFAAMTRGLAASAITRRWRSPLAAAAAIAVAVLAYRIPPGKAAALPSPYPLYALPPTDTPVMDALRAGHGPVLELSRLQSTKPTLNVPAMYRSTLHWRPLVNGYSSYWPSGFPERMRLAAFLPAASALRALVCESGVRTVVVDLTTISNRSTWLRAQQQSLEGLRLAVSTPQSMVFEVTIPPPGEPGAPDCTAFAAQTGRSTAPHGT
jgi:hypothetical protein